VITVEGKLIQTELKSYYLFLKLLQGKSIFVEPVYSASTIT